MCGIFLKVCREIKGTHPDLPLISFCPFYGKGAIWWDFGILGAWTVSENHIKFAYDPSSYRKGALAACSFDCTF